MLHCNQCTWKEILQNYLNYIMYFCQEQSWHPAMKFTFSLRSWYKNAWQNLKGPGFSQGAAEPSVHRSVSKHDPIGLQTHKHDFSVLTNTSFCLQTTPRVSPFLLTYNAKNHFRTSSKNNVFCEVQVGRKKCEIKGLCCVCFLENKWMERATTPNNRPVQSTEELLRH